MYIKPGTIIHYGFEWYTVMFTVKPNKSFVRGRCVLADNQTGHIQWIDKLDIEGAISIDIYPMYAEISQHNYKDERNHIYHKCPKDIHEAREWAETRGGIWFYPFKRTNFGYYTYEILTDGTLVLVGTDLDSSG